MRRLEAEKSLDLTGLRGQDAQAFGELVRMHEPVIAGLCQSMGLFGADLEDAMAEAFAAIYRALPKFEGRSALSTWIYRIATRAIWRVRAAKQRNHHSELRDDAGDDAQASPLEVMEQLQASERIWSAVARLESRQATAVELYYRRDLSIEEIAVVLECPAGTVKTLLFRARETLRRSLKQEDPRR